MAADGRLDAVLAARGLARSRTAAAHLITEGRVSVDGAWIVKPSHRVEDGADIRVEAPDSYVSRGAHKLVAALDAFPVPVDGALCLDVGASTGGFTQVLLERGARRVIALDVGHGQLAPEIRARREVEVVEGVNVRDLTPGLLEQFTRESATPTLVVGDLSFISLTLVLPPLVSTVGLEADYVLLIKPQFEVGRGGIREGIVTSAALRSDAVTRVLWSAWDRGLGTAGLVSSPILGGAGNPEYLVWLTSTGGSNPTEWLGRVNELVGV
ncbi:TlyA family RNA methyltransferase [Planctomonas psychrotolerans]|uniref:TlyA family RNA methyltransferase n=1 Tax=Planctomonas psychrotolerans TaxID=2528712 RepID=UPI00123A76B0|nr:TlyA family RNA methyltransferase [Planctomonas psychrotolerans]